MNEEARDSSGFGLFTGERRPTGLCAKLSADLDRLDRIAIVRERGGNVKIILECIEKEMASEVYVAALFLDLQNGLKAQPTLVCAEHVCS
jgi:hypothetical protein